MLPADSANSIIFFRKFDFNISLCKVAVIYERMLKADFTTANLWD